MIGVVPALNACEGEHSRGFTFLGAKGPGEDLFVSFHDLRLAAQRRAAHYAAAGLERGDRVALVVPEGEHFIPGFLGALLGGRVPAAPLPPRGSPPRPEETPPELQQRPPPHSRLFP